MLRTFASYQLVPPTRSRVIAQYGFENSQGIFIASRYHTLIFAYAFKGLFIVPS